MKRPELGLAFRIVFLRKMRESVPAMQVLVATRVWARRHSRGLIGIVLARHVVHCPRCVMKRVWELKGLLLVSVRHRFGLCVVIRANVTRFLCDSAKHLPLSNGCERVPRLNEDLRRVLCRVTASHIYPHEGKAAQQAAEGLVFIHRPRQAISNLNTVHNLPSAFALLCLFGGRASSWLGRHFVFKELLGSTLSQRGVKNPLQQGFIKLDVWSNAEFVHGDTYFFDDERNNTVGNWAPLNCNGTLIVQLWKKKKTFVREDKIDPPIHTGSEKPP